MLDDRPPGEIDSADPARPAAPTGPASLTVINGLLLTMADGVDPFVGWFTVGPDGTITGIGSGEPPSGGGEILDVAGAIVAPGFVSAHSHLFTSGLRGLAAGETLYGWVQANMDVLAGATAEDIYWFTLHGCLDFVANGVTAAYNFTQSRVIWSYDPNVNRAVPSRVNPVDFVTRQVDATVDSGIRVVNSIRLDDEAFDEREVLDTFDQMASYVRDHVPVAQNLGAAVFGAVQWATSARTAALEAEIMHRHRILNQAHFVETAERIEQQRAKFEWYEQAGALGPRFLFGHFVHPTDDMIEKAAAAGCGMVWQPTSNGRLGSGIADIPRLRAAGIRIGVGLDDQSCTDISDPFQNMRIGMYTVRARYTDASVLLPREMLRMHTLGSAEVLGVADRIGSLEVGKQADFLVVDPASPDTGPIWDAYATYVFACGLRNLKRVHIGGRSAYADGQLTSELATAASVQLHERVAHAARRAGLDGPRGWGAVARAVE
jgi:cytosine/adenosine deaminase-related metal-dependent hydrolase